MKLGESEGLNLQALWLMVNLNFPLIIRRKAVGNRGGKKIGSKEKASDAIKAFVLCTNCGKYCMKKKKYQKYVGMRIYVPHQKKQKHSLKNMQENVDNYLIFTLHTSVHFSAFFSHNLPN